MDIDRAVFEAEGDDSPDTATALFHVPLYRCRNPNCSQKGLLVRGTPTPLQSQKARAFDIGLDCCGVMLLQKTDGVVTIPPEVTHRRDGDGFVVHCSTCGKEQRYVG